MNRSILYSVTWRIEIEAGTPEEAAHIALAIQRDAESTAVVFDVQEFDAPSAKKLEIDLSTGSVSEVTK